MPPWPATIPPPLAAGALSPTALPSPDVALPSSWATADPSPETITAWSSATVEPPLAATASSVATVLPSPSIPMVVVSKIWETSPFAQMSWSTELSTLWSSTAVNV